MPTVRTSRRFVGNGPISLIGLSRLENRTFPVSVRDLITIESRDHTLQVAAGDVHGDVKVTFINTGDWFISANFRDDGNISGDSFELEFVIANTGGVGAGLSGKLGASQTKAFTNRGNDPFIRNHWTQIRNAGVTINIKVTPDVAGAIVGSVGAVISALAIGLGSIFIASGGQVRRCQDPQPFDHESCVEIVPPDH